MNKASQQQEHAFNRRYSRFKLVIYYKTRHPITHYGFERDVTVNQIAWGKVQLFHLDRLKGFNDCLERLEMCHAWYGGFTTAIIYDKLQADKVVYKLVGDNLQVNEIEEAWSVSPQKILCEALHKNNMFIIQPVHLPCTK